MKQNEVFTQINNTIIELLKTPLEFHPSWLNLNAGLPNNLKSTKNYKGVNTILLTYFSIKAGWVVNSFLTYNQIHEIGGKVKKGAKSCPIFFYDVLYFDKNNKKYKKADVELMSESVKASLGIRKNPFLKKHHVFNIELTEGLPKEVYNIPELQTLSPIERNLKAETLLKSLGADIKEKPSNRAYYNKVEDFIVVPDNRQFENSFEYYSTLFHEVVHWTGNKERLNREFGNSLYSKNYAFEELVAELGAAYLCADIGIQMPITNNAAYIQCWLKALNNEPKFFLRATKKAEEAIKYIDSLSKQELQQVA